MKTQEAKVIKMNVRNVVETEREIKLPYYYKLNYGHLKPCYYAILHTNMVIKIDAEKPEITYSTYPEAFVDKIGDKKRFEPSNAEEFVKAFDEAVEFLSTNLKNNLA
jgi:cellobiose phosphorylase